MVYFQNSFQGFFVWAIKNVSVQWGYQIEGVWISELNVER